MLRCISNSCCVFLQSVDCPYKLDANAGLEGHLRKSSHSWDYKDSVMRVWERERRPRERASAWTVNVFFSGSPWPFDQPWSYLERTGFWQDPVEESQLHQKEREKKKKKSKWEQMASCKRISNVVSRGSDLIQPLLKIKRDLFFF